MFLWQEIKNNFKDSILILSKLFAKESGFIFLLS